MHAEKMITYKLQKKVPRFTTVTINTHGSCVTSTSVTNREESLWQGSPTAAKFCSHLLSGTAPVAIPSCVASHEPVGDQRADGSAGNIVSMTDERPGKESQQPPPAGCGKGGDSRGPGSAGRRHRGAWGCPRPPGQLPRPAPALGLPDPHLPPAPFSSQSRRRAAPRAGGLPSPLSPPTPTPTRYLQRGGPAAPPPAAGCLLPTAPRGTALPRRSPAASPAQASPPPARPSLPFPPFRCAPAALPHPSLWRAGVPRGPGPHRPHQSYGQGQVYLQTAVDTLSFSLAGPLHRQSQC